MKPGSRQLLLLQCVLYAVSIAVASVLAHPAAAETPAEFFRGKRVNVLIGVNVGGGYDLEGRLVARYIGKHVPGNPTFVPQNMIGAGGMKMANYLATVAAKDGTNMGVFPNTLITLQAVGGKGVQYDAGKFNWLGSLSTSSITLTAWHAAGVSSFSELGDKELVVAASTPGAITYTLPVLMNEVLGTKLKVVTGYQGTSRMVVALERGEVTAVVNSVSSWRALHPAWLKEGKIKIIVQSDPKDKEFASVPSISDLAKNAGDKALINLVLAGNRLGKPMAFTADVPADRVAALREAYRQMVKDPEFLAAAEKSRVELDLVTGEDLQKMITDVLATPADIVERAKKIVQ